MEQLQPDEVADIAKVASACKHVFEICANTAVLAQEPWFRSAQGQFNLWCAATKATSTSKSSLGFCLRAKRSATVAICELILALGDSVQICEKTLIEEAEREAKSDASSNDGSLSERTESSLSWSAASNASEPGPEDAIKHPLVAEHASYIRIILGQLSRTAVAIRKSGTKYRFGKIDAALDETEFEEFRVHLTTVILRGFEDPKARDLSVWEKIQRSMDWNRLNDVQKRLVKANILRRNRIQTMTKSRRLRTRLTQAVNTPKPLATKVKPQPTPSQNLSRSPAMEPSERIRVANSTNIPLSVVHSEVSIKSAGLTVTEAGSNLSDLLKPILAKKTLSTATRMTKIGASQNYPSCPRRDETGSVICVYCDDLLPSEYAEPKFKESWRAHVAQDLIPYTCFARDCETADEMYLTGDNLLAHMLQKHSTPRWKCDYCAQDRYSKENLEKDELRQRLFNTRYEWIDHVSVGHSGVVSSKEDIEMLADLNRRRFLGPLSCPLCDFDAEQPSASIDDHILAHLHEFALRALPEIHGEAIEDKKTSRMTQASATLSHTKSTSPAVDYLQFANVSYKDIKKEVFKRNIDVSVEEPPLSDAEKPLYELWQMKANRLYASLTIEQSDPLYPSYRNAAANNQVKVAVLDLNSRIRYVDPSHQESGCSWDFNVDEFQGQSESLIIDFNGRAGIIDDLERDIISGPSSNRQTRINLCGPSSVACYSIASELSKRLADTHDYSTRSYHGTGEDNFRGFLILSFSSLTTQQYRDLTGTEVNERTKAILHHLTWHFGHDWLLVIYNLDADLAQRLAFNNFLPQSLRGTILFITTDPATTALLGTTKVVQVPTPKIRYFMPRVDEDHIFDGSKLLSQLGDRLDMVRNKLNPHGHRKLAFYSWDPTLARHAVEQFAYDQFLQSPDLSVFHVCCATTEDLRRSLTEIAVMCQIPGFLGHILEADEDNFMENNNLQKIKNWLCSQTRGTWFTIITDVSEEFNPWNWLDWMFPTDHSGIFFVVANDLHQANALVGSENAFHVPEKKDDDLIFESRLARALTSEFLEIADVENIEDQANEISLNLAITIRLARAFTQNTSLEIPAYLDLLRSVDEQLVGALVKQTGCYRMLITAWMLSDGYILRGSGLARDLALFMSYLDSTAIPVSLIRDFQAYFPEYAAQSNSAAVTREALRVLESFDFISKNGDNAIDVVPQVQVITRAYCELTKRVNSDDAISLLSHHFPPNGHYENWPACAKYLDHGLAVLKNHPFNSAFAFSTTRALLSNSIASYLFAQGRFKEALPLQEQAIKLQEQAIKLQEQAIELQEQAIKLQQIRGTDHPDYMESLTNLGSIYWGLGMYDKAADIEEKAISLKSRAPGLGDHHLSTLTSKANLAATYMCQEKFAEAETLASDVLKHRREQLGTAHPTVAASMNDLGSIYTARGNHEKAKTMFEHAWRARRMWLGPEHPLTLESQMDLAQTLAHEKEKLRAERLSNGTLELMEKVLGLTHPLTIEATINLSLINYKLQHDNHMAASLALRACEATEQAFGPDHPVSRAFADYANDLSLI